jgi:hypothetical protein
VTVAPFSFTSRYYGLETAVLEVPPDNQIVYLKRRLLPPVDRFSVIEEHFVTEGERLDNLAAVYVDDPEQFWRLCDSNGAMRPEELEVVGRILRITLPEGMPGPPSG